MYYLKLFGRHNYWLLFFSFFFALIYGFKKKQSKNKMEKLHTVNKQDQELTVAQIMNSLLPNSELNWRKKGKPLDLSGMT